MHSILFLRCAEDSPIHCHCICNVTVFIAGGWLAVCVILGRIDLEFFTTEEVGDSVRVFEAEVLFLFDLETDILLLAMVDEVSASIMVESMN